MYLLAPIQKYLNLPPYNKSIKQLAESYNANFKISIHLGNII